MSPDVGGIDRGPQLSRLAAVRCRGASANARSRSTCRTRRRTSWKRITSVWRRSRNGLSNIWRSRPAPASLKGPILCLVGPPGVGKTSLGQVPSPRRRGVNTSACRWAACGTKAEIRGHRRTYIGSMPGKHHPVDEESQVRPIRSSSCWTRSTSWDRRLARRSVFGPAGGAGPREQNSTFGDHYLEVDYDLSDRSCS